MQDDVFANKYRPRKFQDVIGQKTTIQSLTNAFKSEDLHHAYILAGNLGCGKTSVARIMAATENCLNKKTEPCGECKNCKDIFAGKSTDVKEIDAASNRGIDDIRELKSESQFNPINCKTKYYILDEAHSLTGHAAEAALKLIEEPPDNVRFVFCTTKSHAITDTIRSRCIFFKFNKVGWPDLFAHLLKIANEEKLEFDEEALKIAAKAANGSVRNALQNLQTIISYCGDDELSSQDAKDILGSPDEKLYFALIDSISKIDVTTGLQTISDLLKDGKEIKKVIEGLEIHLRNLMVILTCSKDLDKFDFLEEELKRLKHQAGSLTEGKEKVQIVVQWMKLLYDVNKGIVVNLDPQILLERYLVEAIISKRKLEKA